MSQDKAGSDRIRMVKDAGVVGGATVVSRILGLVRDAVMAAIFGATPAADAFFVAFRIPNLMRQLFGEGALASSFVPVYTDIMEKEGEKRAGQFASDLFSLLILILTVLTVLGVLFAPYLVRVIALGFTPGSEIFNLTVLLTRWMLPYMVFICAAAFGMGILNSHRHFFAPAAAPALLNISIIIAALLVAPGLDIPVTALAWGVLAGGVMQLLVQLPPMKRRGVIPRLKIPVLTPEVRRMAIIMGPAALGVAVYQVNILVDTLLASFLPAGSITYLWYGNRMMQFPLGVFGIALATAALPTLSSQVAQGRIDDFRGTVSFSLVLTAFIGIPAALGLVVLREPIIATLFGRGAFAVGDVQGAAQALLYYSIGLPLFIGIKILGRAFFALENTRIPFLAAGTALVVNIVLNLLLMGPMGHAGLALATSLASGVNLLILARYFTLKIGPGWFDRALRREILFSFAAATLMLLVIGALAQRVNWMDLTTPSRVLYLVGCMGIGIGVYSVTSWKLGCKGLKTLVNKVFKKP